MRPSAFVVVAIMAGALLAIPACSPATYTVTVENEYFETLNNITVASITIDTLPAMDSSDPRTLAAGEYSFTATSESGLDIKATITLYGLKPMLRLVIERNGRVTLR